RVGPRIDVHEAHMRPGLRNRLAGRNERERHRHHGVADLHPRRDQRQAQRVRATAHPYAEVRLTKLGEVALEPLDHRTPDESRGVERSIENLPELASQFAVDGDQIEKRYCASVHSVSFPTPRYATRGTSFVVSIKLSSSHAGPMPTH